MGETEEKKKKETQKPDNKRRRLSFAVLLSVIIIVIGTTLWRQSNPAKSYFSAGELFYRQKWYEMAEESYQKVLDIEPNYPRVHYMMGLVLYEKGLYEESINEYKKELELIPSYVNINDNLALLWTRLGEAYYRNGIYKASSGDKAGSIIMSNEALIACNKALAMNALFLPAYSLSGQLHYTSGMVDESIKDYEKVLEMSNDENAILEANYRLGIIYASNGDEKRAIRHWKKAIEINPYFTPVLYELGKIYYKEESLDSAINMWRKAIHNEPDFIEAHYDLARAFVKRGWYRDAQREYLVTIKVAMKIKSSAAHSFREKVIPILSGAYTNLGTLYYYEDGDKGKGMDYWKKAIEIDASNEEARENLRKVSKI